MIRIEGHDELREAIRRMPGTMQRSVMRPATASGAQALVKEIKVRAPRDEGPLRRSIGRKAFTDPAKGVVGQVVGPRSGGPEHMDGWYGFLVEFGHVLKVAWGRLMKTPKRVGPHPFQRPAQAAGKPKVFSAVRQKATEKLEAVQDKQARRGLARAVKRG